MMMLACFLVFACAQTFAGGQETSSCSLAQDLNNYCDARCNRHGSNTPVASGPQGRVGKAGPKGEKGSRGQKGDKGIAGPTGEKGIFGRKGDKRILGKKGVAGPPGLKGDAGRTGKAGMAGPPGPAGDRGPRGIVNYTAIEEMITRTVDEAFQRHWDEVINRTTPDGWTVFQRRQDGTVDFDRTWDEYVNGFGNPYGEFWMGLEKLHILTSSGNHELRIYLEDWERNSVFAQYSEFYVGSAATRYNLTVSGYSGTAGDSLLYSGYSGYKHNGMAFSTKDFKNDRSRINCAERYNSGWWFNHCFSSNLNGVYYRHGNSTGTYNDGIIWGPWKNAWWYSMKFVEMKLRPAS